MGTLSDLASSRKQFLGNRVFFPLLIRERQELVLPSSVISIVDDDVSMRASLVRLIKSYDLSAEGFSSAEDFLKSGRSQDSGCLILDVHLPRMSGLELQSHLLVSNPRLPIIFVSAGSNEFARRKALRNGAIEFLQKPFNEDAFLKALKSSVMIHPKKCFRLFQSEQTNSKLAQGD